MLDLDRSDLLYCLQDGKEYISNQKYIRGSG